MSNKDLYIRSSSAEFLIFEQQKKEHGIEVRFEDGDLWLTQKAMAKLYDCSSDNVGLHLKNIYTDLELDRNSTTEEFSVVQKEGNREVKRKVKYYNLDAVISVGYRVNTDRAIQFRRWATNVLKEFSKKGYIIDKKRMENGTFFDEDYFESLLAEIREIRLSERRFYQKITDIYATSIDYDSKSPTTIKFFKKVQNKMHYAVTHQTAAEIIYNRADSTKEHMGLTSWEGAPNSKIHKYDVSIAKNYLSEKEKQVLGFNLSYDLTIFIKDMRIKKNTLALNSVKLNLNQTAVVKFNNLKVQKTKKNEILKGEIYDDTNSLDFVIFNNLYEEVKSLINLKDIYLVGFKYKTDGVYDPTAVISFVLKLS